MRNDKSRVPVDDDIRYRCNGRWEGGAFSTMSEARQWFDERGFHECETCGWSMPAALRHEDRPATLLHLHHVVARSAGGPHAVGNLVRLCPTCHRLAHYLWPNQHRRDPDAERVHRGPSFRGEFITVLRRVLADPDNWYGSPTHIAVGGKIRRDSATELTTK